jgi:hypothetical protein
MRKAVTILVITILPSLASAQTLFRYDAKYVCGKQANPPNNFVAGVYFTSINVYSNPGVQLFKKRFTISRINEKSGGSTGWNNTGLSQGQSMQIDCDNILAHLQQANLTLPPGQVTEGFVIIESPSKLDIVAVYSAGPQNGPVAAMHMERVPIAP